MSIGEQPGFGFGRPGQMISGELKLTKSSMKPGEPIEGQFDLRIVEMRGGMMDRFGGRGRGRSRGAGSRDRRARRSSRPD